MKLDCLICMMKIQVCNLKIQTIGQLEVEGCSDEMLDITFTAFSAWLLRSWLIGEFSFSIVFVTIFFISDFRRDLFVNIFSFYCYWLIKLETVQFYSSTSSSLRSMSTFYTLLTVGRHPKERNAVKMELAEAQVDNLVAALWAAQMEDDMEEENADLNEYYGYDNYDYDTNYNDQYGYYGTGGGY